ncbi:MAG: LapA family protein [Deferrisomatales bacterium]|nr:LapA family protein [Deferrisomatales bacterium]
MQNKLIVAGSLLLLVVIFTLQNAEVVSIRFLFWEFSMSRVILLFLVFAFGMGAGWIVHGLARAGSDPIEF